MEPVSKSNRTTLISVFLVIATLGIYSLALPNQFVAFDDQDYVTANTHVQQGLTWASITWAFKTGYAGNWFPLTWLSHILDGQLFGLSPAGHHVTSVILHSANTLLLFLLLRRMTGAQWRSALVAALFALHPLHVESVAWVSERKDVLSSFFFFLTLLAYTRYALLRNDQPSRDSGAPPHASRSTHHAPRITQPVAPKLRAKADHASHFYLLALFCFALGLMSKSMLVTVPFVLLLLDYWPLGRLRLSKAGPLVLEKVPFLILSLVSSVITYKVQSAVGAVGSTESFPLKLRLANACVGYVRYLRKMLCPSDLAAFYPYPPSWPGWLVCLSLLVLLGITIAIVLGRKRFPYLATGWFWYLGMLVPVIGIIQAGAHSIADRYTYLPLIGVFIILAWGGYDFLAKRGLPSTGMSIAAGSIVAACALLTCIQIRYWKDTLTLFTHATDVTSNNALAEYSIATALVNSSRYDEALPHFERAIQIQPDHPGAHNNLGLILAMHGDLDEAIMHYRRAVDGRLHLPEVHCNLAAALLAKGQSDEAIAECKKALELSPDFLPARCQLAAALIKQGKAAEAENEYSSLLQQKPGYRNAMLGLAQALAAENNFEAATAQLRQGLAVYPDDPDLQFALGDILVEAGKLDDAFAHYSAIRVAHPQLPAALVQHARELAAGGSLTNALQQLSLAQKLAPDDRAVRLSREALLMQTGDMDNGAGQFSNVAQAQTEYNLALSLAMKGDPEALSHYREAVRLNPNWPTALNDLAWVLATAKTDGMRDGRQAVMLAERACNLTHRKEARYLGTLDAAYAEAGRFGEAVATARIAQELASRAGQTNIATFAAQRIKLYQSNLPYRQAQ
jgi:tetratricopeptide (TPR) repeat protein